MGKNNQLHVVPRDDGWGVRRAGAERDSSCHETQRAAEEAARAIARRERGEVVTHGRDGKIRSKDSYGPDPFPSRDKEH